MGGGFKVTLLNSFNQNTPLVKFKDMNNKYNQLVWKTQYYCIDAV